METKMTRTGSDQRADRASTRASHAMRGSVALLLLVVGLMAIPAAQTGQVMPPPKFQAWDASGNPCNGCKLFAYEAGTTTKQDTYTSSALSVANANPVVLDAAGRATVFLSPSLSYKFVLAPSDDTDPPSNAIWTVDNVVGPFSGVITVTAANTRGVQISRSSAEAGLSIASTGGSGKTYGILSNTSGALRIQDDSDATPRIELTGNDINLTATGVVAVTNNATVGGTFGVTGASTLTGAATLSSTLAVAGASTLTGAVTTGSTVEVGGGYSTTPSAVGGLRIGVQNATDRVQLIYGDGTGYKFHIGTRSGGSFVSNFTVDDRGYLTAPRQPGFLAYNSAADNAVATGATVDFDTEVYDEAGNFASDTFTAPVTGRYQLCVTVTYSDNAASTYGLRIVTSARSYRVDWSGGTTSGVGNGCVYADMASGATASIQVDTGDGTGITIEGGASPLSTFFSGRLVP